MSAHKGTAGLTYREKVEALRPGVIDSVELRYDWANRKSGMHTAARRSNTAIVTWTADGRLYFALRSQVSEAS